ncbi:MAG TPA: hypothetical protein VFE86_05815 [Ilumatobacteraceae bacterium]|nr:hypothetical protein [Ilumatobacteraceae bacterium]
MTDLDPLLHDAVARVRGPIDSRPSMTDVRRRARRRNRRRMTATVGVVACTGVATAALIVRRDSVGPSAAAPVADDSSSAAPTSTVNPLDQGSTTTTFGLPSLTITASKVWDALFNARYDPSGAGLVVAPADQAAADVMPTPDQFGCTSPECAAMFNYVVWHEIAVELGFSSIQQMQAMNSGIDFSQPPREGDVVASIFGSAGDGTATTSIDPNNETPTTISLFDGVVLIDAGAPAGAMEDAYERLPGYDRVIVPSSGKTTDHTMVMPIAGNDALATGVGGVFGIDGLDTWDPSFIGTNMQGMVAVVIGPDYYDRIHSVSTTVASTTSLGG